MEKILIYKNSKIAYSDVGKGSAVVLLHGFLESSIIWNDIKGELIKKNRVICIDLLGHGNTDSIGYVHTMDDMAMAVKEVLNTLLLRKFYMIGHSMGGYVSLAFAELYPKNIKGICLLNSTAQADSNERKSLRLRACEMAKVNYDNLVKMSVANLFTPQTREQFSVKIAEVKKIAKQTSVQGYIAATKGMQLRENKEATIQTIDKRLIIVGKKDTVLNYQSVIEEAARTKTPFIELPNGHMSYIEDKEILIEVLKRFIN